MKFKTTTVEVEDEEFDTLVAERLLEAYHDVQEVGIPVYPDDKDNKKLVKALKRVYNYFCVPSKQLT